MTLPAQPVRRLDLVRLGDALDRYAFGPSSPYPLAAVRIALGAFLLVYFLVFAPDVEVLFSSRGVYVPYLTPDYAPPPALAWVAYAALLGACVLFTVGAATRYVTPALLALFLYHYFLEIAEKNSTFDRLTALFLVVLCLSNPGAVWSWDARRERDAPRPSVPSWAARVLRFQLIVVYFSAGLWKALDPPWRDGTLLRATFQGPWASPLAFFLVRHIEGAAAWRAFSVSIIVFELVLATCLVFRRTRPLGLVMGIGFHLMNCVILVIPEFVMCISVYPLFLREETVRVWGERVLARLSPKRA